MTSDFIEIILQIHIFMINFFHLFMPFQHTRYLNLFSAWLFLQWIFTVPHAIFESHFSSFISILYFSQFPGVALFIKFLFMILYQFYYFLINIYYEYEKRLLYYSSKK